MRCIFLLFLLALLAPILAFAQKSETQAKIDSIESKLKTATEDSAKATLYRDLTLGYQIIGETDKAIANGLKGLEIARKIGNYKLQGDCNNSLGTIYGEIGDREKAITYFRANVEINKKSGNKKALAIAYGNIGLEHKSVGDISSSLRFYFKALQIEKKLGLSKGMADTYLLIGNAYNDMGNYAKALEAYQKALRLAEKLNRDSKIATVLGNIGAFYYSQNQPGKALDYHKRSIAIKQQLGDKRGTAHTLNNIGVIYKDKGDLETAERYFRQSLQLKREIRDRLGESVSLENLGQISLESCRYQHADSLFRSALVVSKEIDDKIGMSSILQKMATLELLRSAPSEARRIAARSLALARQTGGAEYVKKAAKTLSKADSALGDYKSAYEHYKLYKQYSDSLKNDEQSKEIGRLEAKYDFDKEIAERERREAEAAARRERIMWVAISVFSALLIVAGLLTWGFQTKKKANKQLALHNAEIRRQSEEISQQRDELQTLNERLTEQKAEVEKARDEIAEQHKKLEKAHEEITDSIDYASRIQQSLLPAETTLQKGAEAYVYYKPRDVVSGDFYWMNQLDEDTALYSAADCTGHGVPGAFMSVLGATTLDTIVREYGETRPNEILGLLDLGIRNALKQDENEGGSLDGMDLALIKLDKKNRKLNFSSAGRPLFLLRNGEIIEYKGAKFPAGGAQHGEKEFPLIEIDLEPGDRIFMCSDGVTDQFGGPRKRKFSPRRLKETLLAHRDKSLQAQGAAFAEVFDEWQKAAKQLDDQLLLALAA